MSKKPNNTDLEAYDDLELLERLETLREDMEDLGMNTLAEVIAHIEALHTKLDEEESDTLPP